QSNVTPPTPKDISFIDSVSAATARPPALVVDIPGAAAEGGKIVGFVMPPKDADKPNTAKSGAPILYQQDAPSCSDCGSIMVRNGGCYKCLNCGSTSGCS